MIFTEEQELLIMWGLTYVACFMSVMMLAVRIFS